jgi:alkylation response protein AidB-like acyl-CoA dehydrogenase
MDFGFTEDQESLRSLAAKLLDDARGDDPGLWARMGDAGLVGAPLQPPNGEGMGIMGLCVVAEELGRRALLSPYTVHVSAALVLERVAPERLVADLAAGPALATIALEEPSGYDPLQPSALIDSGGRLSGAKTAVPWAAEADFFLVGAVDHRGRKVLALLERGAGVEVEPATGTAGEPLGRVHFDATPVPPRHAFGGSALETAHDILLAAECATAAGVLDGGLRITAQYIAGREQFGRPIAAFQGPALRIADAYIDTQAVWAATWSAIWRLATGRPAGEALAIAKFWVADGGQRAVHAFQHLHGGMGVDTSYPIHRYFALAKALEVRLGGAPVQLERLGAALAAES